MMEHKGYSGKVEFDADAGVLHGEVLGIRDVVTFQGTSVKEVEKAFRESVDDYLAFCKERGEAPDKPYSGRFLIRIDAELHRQLNIAATAANESLNSWVADRLKEAVQRPSRRTARIGTRASRSAGTRSKPRRSANP